LGDITLNEKFHQGKKRFLGTIREVCNHLNLDASQLKILGLFLVVYRKVCQVHASIINKGPGFFVNPNGTLNNKPKLIYRLGLKKEQMRISCISRFNLIAAPLVKLAIIGIKMHFLDLIFISL